MATFEWTHLPIQPEVFRKMVRTIELKKKGPWTTEECQKMVLDKYGVRDLVGWLDEGDSEEKVIKLLGEPTRKLEGGALVWEKTIRDGDFLLDEKLVLPFEGGKLQRFDHNYYDSGRGNQRAIEGTVTWMEKQIEPYDGDEDLVMPEPLKKRLLDLFLEKSKGADAGDFDRMCGVVNVLVERGLKDEEILTVVRERYKKERGHYAAWVLHHAGQEQDVELFVEHVREIYAKAEKVEEADSSDLHNILCFIPREHESYLSLVRKGFQHRNAKVRESVYWFIDSRGLSKKEQLIYVRKGLFDTAPRVRYWSASYFEDHEMSEADWKLLKKAANKEQDESTREAMEEILSKKEKPL